MNSLEDIAWARLRLQRLVGPPFATPVEVVRRLAAVQAQDYTGAKWAIGQRAEGCVDDDVERAFGEGRILRTHVLRPTWHFVAPEDIRWMLALTAPRLRAAMRSYDGQLGLTERLYSRASGLMARALAGGNHLTREELAGVLARAGIEAAGQRLGHIVMRAEVDAVVCSGRRRGKQLTYALLDERAPSARPLARDEALRELAVRYFCGHGPAQALDFAWWSGLSAADARRGVALADDRLTALTIDGRTYWHGPLPTSAAPPLRRSRRSEPGHLVHLLPNYDEYVIAYKDRRSVTDRTTLPFSPGARDAVFASHLVILDGRLIGGWRRLVEKKTTVVETRLLIAASPAQRKALEAAARRLAAFLDQPVELRPAPAA